VKRAFSEKSLQITGIRCTDTASEKVSRNIYFYPASDAVTMLDVTLDVPQWGTSRRTRGKYNASGDIVR